MASLLGQFFPYIKGSQEDIASKGLAYILQMSKVARAALSNFIFNNTNISFEDISYITQSTGQNLERPDISGLNENGNEVIIIEAKFWATLTNNKPLEYLNRIGNNSVLLFICPKLREISLIEEICFRLRNNNLEYELLNNKLVLQNNRYILIIDWKSLLNLIKDVLIKNNENTSDIEQIIGFCEIIDNNTFLPINDMDLSPSFAKRINTYYDLIDKIIDYLKIHTSISLDGMKATPQKYGYTRYFHINNYGIALNLDLKCWENLYDTPFWLTIKSTGNPWKQTNDLQNKLKAVSIKTKIKIYEFNNILSFALIPKINQIEEVVIKNISNDIIKIINELS